MANGLCVPPDQNGDAGSNNPNLSARAAAVEECLACGIQHVAVVRDGEPAAWPPLQGTARGKRGPLTVWDPSCQACSGRGASLEEGAWASGILWKKAMLPRRCGWKPCICSPFRCAALPPSPSPSRTLPDQLWAARDSAMLAMVFFRSRGWHAGRSTPSSPHRAGFMRGATTTMARCACGCHRGLPPPMVSRAWAFGCSAACSAGVGTLVEPEPTRADRRAGVCRSRELGLRPLPHVMHERQRRPCLGLGGQLLRPAGPRHQGRRLCATPVTGTREAPRLPIGRRCRAYRDGFTPGLGREVVAFRLRGLPGPCPPVPGRTQVGGRAAFAGPALSLRVWGVWAALRANAGGAPGRAENCPASGRVAPALCCRF